MEAIAQMFGCDFRVVYEDLLCHETDRWARKIFSNIILRTSIHNEWNKCLSMALLVWVSRKLRNLWWQIEEAKWMTIVGEFGFSRTRKIRANCSSSTLFGHFGRCFVREMLIVSCWIWIENDLVCDSFSVVIIVVIYDISVWPSLTTQSIQTHSLHLVNCLVLLLCNNATRRASTNFLFRI